MTQPSPTPAEIDALAKQYDELKKEVLQDELALADKKQQLSIQKEKLVGLVSDHGGAHAQKSKILFGLGWQLKCTYGTEVRLDPAAVENFRLKLVEANKPRLLTKLFDKEIRWTLNPQASVIVRSEKLPDELIPFFAKCEVLTAKTPSLKVELREKTA